MQTVQYFIIVKRYCKDNSNIMIVYVLPGSPDHVADSYYTQELANLLFSPQAAAFLEPASTHFSKPLGFSIPALAYGTQLCMEAPQCCNMKYGYFHFYSELVCPKILMNVTVSYFLAIFTQPQNIDCHELFIYTQGYGHCDLLNEKPGWDCKWAII